MAMSTFQKVTLGTCVVLCVGLLLPKVLLSRGRKDAAERPEGSSHFPPMAQRQAAPEGRGQRSSGASSFNRAQGSEGVARGKGSGSGVGTSGKSNLAGQIIPVYGFGILVYILYILFKITSRGSNRSQEGRTAPVPSENKKRKITDFELLQLQEKLRDTEQMMESMVSTVTDSVSGVMVDQEESLLLQLTEITRVMQERKMVERVTPEKEDETRNQWEEEEYSGCSCCDAQKKDHVDAAQRQDEEVKERGSVETTNTESAPAEEPAAEVEELELEVTLKTRVDVEKMEEICSSVRRRNKRRRVKKDNQ